MRTLYHLIPLADWEQQPAGPYAPESLLHEGFIHCSTREQLEKVANAFYRDVVDLVALEINATLLGKAVHYEPAAVPADDPFAGERFPHLYGPLPRAAISNVLALKRTDDGLWHLPG